MKLPPKNMKAWPIAAILLSGLISCGPVEPASSQKKPSIPMTVQNQSKLAELLPQAEAGDAKAQFQIAQLYDSPDDKGSPEAGKEALFWYEKAAAQNYHEAAEHAGYVILNGLAGEIDHPRAMQWLMPAADRGSEWALFMIGTSYLRGQGIPADPAQAFNWFERAAVRGSAEARFRVGYAYARGQGTVKNEAKAIEWFQMGAKKGNSSARACLGAMAWGGLGQAQDYKLAKFWFEEAMASKGGNTWAPFMLGLMSENGQGLPRDMKKAKAYYQQSAEGGYYQGKIRYALLQKSGAQEQPETLEFLIRGSEKGNALDQFVLGLAYRQGYGVPVDETEALVWLELSTVYGMPAAREAAADLRRKLSPDHLRQADERIKKLREGFVKTGTFLF